MNVPWGHRDWQRALVYGLGSSGTAASRLLRSRGVRVVGVDQRSRGQLHLDELAEDPGMELVLGEDPRQLPEGIDGVVVSPGVPLDRPLLRAARIAEIPVIAEVELGCLFAAGPIIGITGSNGKSTTTAMTGQLLAAAGFAVEVCGNIGVPLSARVDGPADRIFVAELSSFQLETIETFRPRAAALLNLSADHLDRHLDGEAYFAAKRALFKNQGPGDVAVLNADDARVVATEVRSRRRLFSRRQRVADGCFLDGDVVIEIDPGSGSRPLFRSDDLALPGLHNLENAMAAALLSRSMDARAALFPKALGRFRGLPHRLEKVRERAGVTWFDDSKATNTAATLSSLEGFADGSVHLILGGRSKGEDPAALAPMVARKARHVYLVGEAAAAFQSALAGRVACDMSGTMGAAVAAAAAGALRGETVLLSPACASFDQYRDFSHRGDHFQELVRALDG